MLFLSFATLATGWVFFRHFDRVGGTGAGLLAGSFLLWGIHHLDYLILRAQGAWNPWGYYLDIFFELAVGTGILLLVLDDLRRGLGALGALSGDLQRAGREDQDVLAALLERPLALPAVSGTALYCADRGGGALRAGRRGLRQLAADATAGAGGAARPGDGLRPAAARAVPRAPGPRPPLRGGAAGLPRHARRRAPSS